MGVSSSQWLNPLHHNPRQLSLTSFSVEVNADLAAFKLVPVSFGTRHSLRSFWITSLQAQPSLLCVFSEPSFLKVACSGTWERNECVGPGHVQSRAFLGGDVGEKPLDGHTGDSHPTLAPKVVPSVFASRV